MLNNTTLAVCIACLCFSCAKSEPEATKASQALGSPSAPTSTGTNTSAAPSAAADDPKEIFKARCVMCHGESGKGDGVAAAALNPKPRNYTDPEWQKTVTDEQLRKVISGGGAAVGKSPTMPPQPDLANKPEVLDGLVKIIRSFGA